MKCCSDGLQLYFCSNGLLNPVGSADLHFLHFLCPMMCCLYLFVIVLSSEMPVFFVVEPSQQGLSNLLVQTSRL